AGASLTTSSANQKEYLSAAGSINIGDNDLSAGSATIELDGGTFFTTSTGSILSFATVASGATLGGNGRTAGVTVSSGGHLAPGSSPGTINTDDLTLDSGATFDIDLGTSASDQANVT